MVVAGVGLPAGFLKRLGFGLDYAHPKQWHRVLKCTETVQKLNPEPITRQNRKPYTPHPCRYQGLLIRILHYYSTLTIDPL